MVEVADTAPEVAMGQADVDPVDDLMIAVVAEAVVDAATAADTAAAADITADASPIMVGMALAVATLEALVLVVVASIVSLVVKALITRIRVDPMPRCRVASTAQVTLQVANSSSNRQ